MKSNYRFEKIEFFPSQFFKLRGGLACRNDQKLYFIFSYDIIFKLKPLEPKFTRVTLSFFFILCACDWHVGFSFFLATGFHCYLADYIISPTELITSIKDRFLRPCFFQNPHSSSFSFLSFSFFSSSSFTKFVCCSLSVRRIYRLLTCDVVVVMVTACLRQISRYHLTYSHVHCMQRLCMSV